MSKIQQKAPRPDTKTLIINTARTLFNEKGFAGTTTAAIAKAAGKTEGNVWYHFKSKSDLLDAIYIDAVERVEQRIALRPSDGGDIIHDYAKMLRFFAGELRDFRFLYRDLADYGQHTDNILKKLPRIYRETLAQFGIYFDAMIKEKHLANEPDRIEVLLEASIFVIRYHLEISKERGIDNTPGSGAIQEAFELHIKLFERLLTPEAAKILRAEIAS